MNIAIAQINSTIGDFDGNARKITDYAVQAKMKFGARLVLFPELAVCGYPPMDLPDQNSFVELNIRTVSFLQEKLPKDIAVGIGYVRRNERPVGKSLVNSYVVIYGGASVFEQTKTLLPTYDVFDEARNFEPADKWGVFEFDDEKIGIAICEDLWRETETPGTKYVEDPVGRLLSAGITMLCVPSASPFYANKHDKRIDLARNVAHRGNIPIIYINAVGANDSIIFDGRSFFLKGGLLKEAKAFEEELITLEVRSHDISGVSKTFSDVPEIEAALVMGIRDYMNKCGFKRAHLGLSGGIDSALVAYLAVRAAGAENITTLGMPSRFSSKGSKDDAEELAHNLGCRYELLPIEPVFEAFLKTLEEIFEGRPFDIAEENLQARIRGSLLMAYSNKWGSMLLTTGNKSELAMGYCTLYGDMNGALCPIGDLFKTEVFSLCRKINENYRLATGKDIIPNAIIEKPPSAELRPNQKDEDTLPPYEVLDEMLKLYLFENLSADEIALRGYDAALASHIIITAARAEFKRRQAPPVLKVSPRAFGMGRRMPIARVVYEGEISRCFCGN